MGPTSARCNELVKTIFQVLRYTRSHDLSALHQMTHRLLKLIKSEFVEQKLALVIYEMMRWRYPVATLEQVGALERIHIS